jgi:hypothetical protein
MKHILKPIGMIVLSLGGAIGWMKVQTIYNRRADAAPIARHRDAALAQLDRLKRVAELVDQRGPLEDDSLSLPLAQASFKKYAKPPPDGAFINLSQLTTACLATEAPRPDPMVVDFFPFWGRCISWVHTGRDPNGDPPRGAVVVDEELREFLSVKYLGVARIVDFREPTTLAADMFSGGRHRFDVFFYELADEPRYLGGFRVDAANSSQIKYEYRTKTRSMDQSEWLIRNLRYQTQSALIEGLRSRAPGVVTQDPDYYKPDIEKTTY